MGFENRVQRTFPVKSNPSCKRDQHSSVIQPDVNKYTMYTFVSNDMISTSRSMYKIIMQYNIILLYITYLYRRGQVNHDNGISLYTSI